MTVPIYHLSFIFTAMKILNIFFQFNLTNYSLIITQTLYQGSGIYRLLPNYYVITSFLLERVH